MTARSLILAVSLLTWCCHAVANLPEADGAQLERTIRAYRTNGAESTLETFEQLARSFGEQGDDQLQLRSRRYVAECHWRLGQFEQSRLAIDQAMAQAVSLDAQRELGDLNNVLGLLNWDSGRFDEALLAFDRTRAIAEALGDTRLQAMALNNGGLVLDELGNYAKARTQYTEALALYRESNFERGTGDSLGNLGGTYLLLGHYSEALALYEQALEISERLDSTTALSQDHGNIALCLLGMGRIAEAVFHFDQAIAFSRRAGMPLDEAYWSAHKGSALMDSGRYDLGLTHYRQAIETYERIGARTELIETRHELGQLLATLGDDVKAEHEFNRALQESRSRQFDRGITMNLMSLGILQIRRGQWDRAAALFEQAIQRSEAVGQQAMLSQSLLHKARIEQEKVNLDEAGRMIERASTVARQYGAQPLVAEATYLAGENLRLQEQAASALEMYSAAYSLAIRTASPELQWRIQRGRAQALESAGELALAVEALQAAVGIIEGVRSHLLESRYRSGYLQDKHEVYVDLVRIQLKLGASRTGFRNGRTAAQPGLFATGPAHDRQESQRGRPGPTI